MASAMRTGCRQALCQKFPLFNCIKHANPETRSLFSGRTICLAKASVRDCICHEVGCHVGHVWDNCMGCTQDSLFLAVLDRRQEP